MAAADRNGCSLIPELDSQSFRGLEAGEPRQHAFGRGDVRGFWTDCEWVQCSDGFARPVEPGAFPLAHGVPGRVGKLRAYGNAIVPQVAAAFVFAYIDALEETE